MTAPTEWGIEEAGERYLSMVEGSNAALDRLGEFWRANREKEPTEALGERLADLCAQWAVAEEQFLRDMQAGLWPAAAQPHIDDLMDDTASNMAAIQACAEADDIAASVTALDLAAAGAMDNGPAVQVRVVLGLPLPD